MNSQDYKKLVLENAALKRTLEQKECQIAGIKEKVNKLNKQKKALNSQLERSKKKNKVFKSTLVEEQKNC